MEPEWPLLCWLDDSPVNTLTPSSKTCQLAVFSYGHLLHNPHKIKPHRLIFFSDVYWIIRASSTVRRAFTDFCCVLCCWICSSSYFYKNASTYCSQRLKSFRCCNVLWTKPTLLTTDQDSHHFLCNCTTICASWSTDKKATVFVTFIISRLSLSLYYSYVHEGAFLTRSLLINRQTTGTESCPWDPLDDRRFSWFS